MLLLVGPAQRWKVSLRPETASRLAALGVTRAAVLRNVETVAVLLEGWAFDPEGAVEAAIAAVGAPDDRCRVLRSLADISLPIGAEAWSEVREAPPGETTRNEGRRT